MESLGYDEVEVRAELARLLASPQFTSSRRLSRFLTYVVDRTLARADECLKESVIGTEVFDRTVGYDPKAEPIVRTEARRLRAKLDEYYAGNPRESRVRISIPRGAYIAEFANTRRMVTIKSGRELVSRPPEPIRPVDGAVVAEFIPHSLPEQPEPEAAPPQRRSRLALFAGITAIALVVGLILLIWNYITGPRPKWFDGPVVRFTINLPPDQEIVPNYGRNLALSPDGRLLAYVVRQAGQYQLVLRSFDTGETKILPGSQGAHAPVFSPDGLKIAAYVDGHIREFPLYGPPRDIAPAAKDFFAPGVAWDARAGILFNDAPSHDLIKAPSVIFRTSGPGVKPEEIMPIDRSIDGDQTLMIQQVLPRGHGILISGRSSPPHQRYIAIVDAKSGQKTIVMEEAMGAHHIPTGHLIFYRDGNLEAAALDLPSKRVTGPSIPVLHGVALAGWQGPDVAISQNGTLAYIPGLPSVPDLSLVWVDLQGRERAVPLPPGPYWPLDISPDGKKLLLSRFDPLRQNWTLWSFGFEDGVSRQLAGPSPDVIAGCWSADGTKVIFGSKQNNIAVGEILSKASDGSGPETSLTSHLYFGHFPQSRSSDGRWIAYVYGTLPGKKSDIWLLDLADQNHPVVRPFVQTVGWDTSPAISPDGQWLAYSSTVGAQPEVFLQPFPNGGNPLQLTETGADGPMWSPDSKTLYYRAGKRMMALPIQPRIGKAYGLFEGNYMSPDLWQTFNLIAPDGKSFLLVHEPPTARQGQINVITNWFSEVSGILRPKPVSLPLR